MSLSSVSADVRSDQQSNKLNENEFSNEKLNQDDETQLRFNQNISSNGNNANSNFKSTSSLSTNDSNRTDSESNKNVDLLDNNSEKAFSLTRLNEQQMVQSIVDQNNNEFFSSTDKFPNASLTDLNNNVISSDDNKNNQSNSLLQQSFNQIVNGLGNSFVPSTNDDLLGSQMSFLNQTNLQSNSGLNSNQDAQDSQTKRAITGAHNFNNSVVNRSQSGAMNTQQTASALFKQQQAYNLNWPTGQQNPVSGWSTNSQNTSLLNQPSSQQSTQPSLNSWNVLNNTLNSLSNVKQGQPRGLSNSNLSASPVSPLKKSNSQLSGNATNQTLLNTQQLGQLSPLSPKFRQNRPPLMNTNTNAFANAMLMMQNMDINNNAPSALDNYQQLLEIMRSTDLQNTDTLRGKCSPASVDCSLNSARANLPRRRGKSPFFTSSDQDFGGLDGSNQISGESTERFSRKVFVGGLPPDIDEEEIKASFRRFGSLAVDWPHKAESKSYFPPKGYAFLLFQDEASVQALIAVCIEEDNKLYLCVSSPTIRDKPVQIRPWRLSDADFVLDASMPLDPRKTVFVGGVPRPLKAVELAMIMDRLYGGVCYAGIDTDPELKYPKGAGRVAFSNQQSYIAAISARFVQLQHADIEKRVEVKPYVLDDQICDECGGSRCNGKFAPFFCANVTCLQYYCEQCWSQIHTRPGREFHKPLVKEGADRPRAVPFKFKKVI